MLMKTALCQNRKMQLKLFCSYQENQCFLTFHLTLKYCSLLATLFTKQGDYFLLVFSFKDDMTARTRSQRTPLSVATQTQVGTIRGLANCITFITTNAVHPVI